MKQLLNYNPLIPEFEKFIRASKSGKRRKSDGKRLSIGTIETYQNCKRVVTLFAEKFGDMQIYTGLRVNKQIFKCRTRYWKSTLNQFNDFLQKLNYSETYIWNNLKILKTLFHYLRHEYGFPEVDFADFKQPRLLQPEPITLSLPQLKELIHVQFDNSFKGKRLSVVRDIFLTGCITALRFSDLHTLKWTNIVKRDEKYWLEVLNKKTGVFTKLLIPSFLIESLLKYRRLRRQKIFPDISNVNMNLQIKRLGKRLNWINQTQVIKSKNGELKIERVGKFYELLTTHTMRRTGITLMLQLGMPENMVRQISGHAPNSKEFYRYIRIAQSWKDEESERIHNLIDPKS